MKTKTFACTRCCKTKPLTAKFFQARKNSKTGFRSQCKECRREMARSCYRDNKDAVQARKRQWRDNNPEKVKQLKEKYRGRYKEQEKEYNRQYAKKNRAAITARVRNRRRNDPAFRAQGNLYRRITGLLSGTGKFREDSLVDLVGCDLPKLRLWLELYFRKGMSWSNYGQWEVDHKKPCADFDLSDLAQQRKCFHYTNLQPLWREENRKKGDRTDWVLHED